MTFQDFKIVLLLAGVTYVAPAISQNRQDNKWIMGSSTGAVKHFEFDFSHDTTQVNLVEIPFAFSAMNSSISDDDGNLLLYFNGCDIADGNHEILENGSGFNEGIIGNWECPKNYGYPGAYQSALILPKPESDSIYYVFHINDFYTNQSIGSSLLYSIVTLDRVSDRGKVVLKNQHALQDSFVTSAGLTAIRHSDNESWWIILARQYGGKYSRILLTKDSLIEYQDLTIGIDSLQYGGQASFSPDGTKYFRYTSVGLTVMDFDRITGIFSNNRELLFKAGGFWYGGAFSPNSRFIYLSDRDKIYQVDTWEEELSLELVEVWDGVKYNGWTVSFSMMQTGPDCRIYISSVSCLPLVHIIMNPDEKGEACNVVQRALELKSSNCGFPHFPNFRLGTSEPYCDPNKVVLTSTNNPIQPKAIFDLYPNPTQYEFILESDRQIESVTVWTTAGKLMYHSEVKNKASRIETHDWPAGIYFVQVTIKDESKPETKKVIVIP